MVSTADVRSRSRQSRQGLVLSKATKDEIGQLVRLSIRRHLRQISTPSRTVCPRKGREDIKRLARRRCKRTQSKKATNDELGAARRVKALQDEMNSTPRQEARRLCQNSSTIIRQSVEQQRPHKDLSLDGHWLPALPTPGYESGRVNPDESWAVPSGNAAVTNPGLPGNERPVERGRELARPATVDPRMSSSHRRHGDPRRGMIGSRAATAGERQRSGFTPEKLASASVESRRRRDDGIGAIEGSPRPALEIHEHDWSTAGGHRRRSSGPCPRSPTGRRCEARRAKDKRERRRCATPGTPSSCDRPEDRFDTISDGTISPTTCRNAAVMLERSRVLVAKAKVRTTSHAHDSEPLLLVSSTTGVERGEDRSRFILPDREPANHVLPVGASRDMGTRGGRPGRRPLSLLCRRNSPFVLERRPS